MAQFSVKIMHLTGSVLSENQHHFGEVVQKPHPHHSATDDDNALVFHFRPQRAISQVGTTSRDRTSATVSRRRTTVERPFDTITVAERGITFDWQAKLSL
ncbi:hypothetical protein MCELHM10_04182 [Paracoccaceae bacterium]